MHEGESLGVMGRNGAGKSTLLQMLCGVTAPTRGRVRIRGRVAPLISVGVGFHPELTGRENVYVNGTVLGMSRREIDARFEEVVAFAEVEEFIDTPVKFYSSGMFVRLGFSVAVAADPDVLLVDEVLAVGDFAFQMKCFARMEEIRRQGTTIVVVSHNMAAMRRLCDRGVVLQRGRKVFDGPVHEAVSTFYATVGSNPDDEAGLLDGVTGSDSGGPAASLEAFTVLDATGAASGHLSSGQPAVVRMRVRARTALRRPVIGVAVTSENGIPVYADTNLAHPFPPLAAGEVGEYDARLQICLGQGGYTVIGSVHEADGQGGTTALAHAAPVSFYVAGRPMVKGLADLGAHFEQV